MTKYLLILVAALLAGCGQSKPRLNILMYPEMLDSKIVAEFERQFDCKVTVDNCSTPEGMIAKLAAGGTGLYDIVVPDKDSIPAMVQRALLAPLRHENIPNLRNIDPQFLNNPADPGNRYGAPYTWAFTCLFIRTPRDKLLEETWGLIFDPSKQPGPFVLVDYPYPCIDAALRFEGHKTGSTNSKELIEARDLLIETKKRSLGFADLIASRNRVLAKEAVMALVGNVDAAIGMKEDPETTFIVPREGTDRWFDNLSIPAQSPHRDLAEKFINYILDAKVGAQNANFNRASSPNKAALEFINPSDRKSPALYPTPEVMSRLLYSKPVLAEQAKLYDELWTQIKAK